MHQGELAKRKEEEEWDYWFNRLWPMTKPKQTWWEKCLAKQEGGSGEEASKVILAKGEENPGSGVKNPESGNGDTDSGNCHSELCNRNPDSGNSSLGKENDRQGEEPVSMDVNMVFMIPVEFCTPMEDIMKLALGVEHAVFEKPEYSGVHMKPLFIQGHLDGMSIRHMLIDGGESVNIL
jgi:hypothetical protein